MTIPRYVQDISTYHQKMVRTLKNKLQGAYMADPDYFRVFQAFIAAENFHEGRFRKDNITPEFLHPVQATLHLMTLPNLLDLKTSIGAMLIHDYPEDSGVGYAELVEKLGCPKIASAGYTLAKVRQGVELDKDAYFEGLANCPVASICKGCDRVNNQGTMGGFTPQKQLEQADETEKYILPMLKKAQRKFLLQEAAYENLKLILRNQVNFIRAQHDN